MNRSHAAATGAVIGILFALAICIFMDFPLSDLLFRTLILGISGAWMGWLLALLDELLPDAEDFSDQDQDQRT